MDAVIVVVVIRPRDRPQGHPVQLPDLVGAMARPRCRCLGKFATGIKGTKAPGAGLVLCLAEGPFPAGSGCSRLDPQTRPSSLPLPAEGGGLGLAVQDEAQLSDAFLSGAQFAEALGYWTPFQPCSLSEDTLPSSPGGWL